MKALVRFSFSSPFTNKMISPLDKLTAVISNLTSFQIEFNKINKRPTNAEKAHLASKLESDIKQLSLISNELSASHSTQPLVSISNRFNNKLNNDETGSHTVGFTQVNEFLPNSSKQAENTVVVADKHTVHLPLNSNNSSAYNYNKSGSTTRDADEPNVLSPSIRSRTNNQYLTRNNKKIAYDKTGKQTGSLSNVKAISSPMHNHYSIERNLKVTSAKESGRQTVDLTPNKNLTSNRDKTKLKANKHDLKKDADKHTAYSPSANESTTKEKHGKILAEDKTGKRTVYLSSIEAKSSSLHNKNSFSKRNSKASTGNELGKQTVDLNSNNKMPIDNNKINPNNQVLFKESVKPSASLPLITKHIVAPPKYSLNLKKQFCTNIKEKPALSKGSNTTENNTLSHNKKTRFIDATTNSSISEKKHIVGNNTPERITKPSSSLEKKQERIQFYKNLDINQKKFCNQRLPNFYTGKKPINPLNLDKLNRMINLNINSPEEYEDFRALLEHNEWIKNGTVNIENVSCDKNGKVSIICEHIEQKSKLHEIIKELNYVANDTKIKEFKFAIHGVPKSSVTKQIFEELAMKDNRFSLNKTTFGEKFPIDSSKNIITFSCKNETAVEFIKKPFVFIGLKRYNIRNFIDLIQCYKCSEFGHRSDKCPVKEMKSKYKCPNCAGNHQLNECSQIYKPKCANCLSLKVTDHEHSSWDVRCPYRRNYIAIRRKIIDDYG